MADNPDVLVNNAGSVWMFNPMTPEAKAWFDENVPSEDWQWLGSSLVVEARYALGLVEGIMDAGLKVG